MSKLKKIIMVVLILLIIIVGILVYVVYKNRSEVIYGIDEEGSDISYDIDETIQIVTNRNDFYAVKNCVNKFYTYYASIYESEEEFIEESKEDIEKANAEVIYNLLDLEYINSRNITKDNILTKLEKMNTSIVNITEMYVSERTLNISVYIVRGTLREQRTGKISDFQLMLKLDSLNRTFTVLPQEYINEKYSDLKVGNEINIEASDSIEKNENNAYDFKNISDEEYVTDLFQKYKEEILYNSELAYNHLDEEYRNKRFETLENFQIYAKNNIRNNVIAKLKEYQKNQYENYTEYVCIDEKGSGYIFMETSVMNYALILDTYTIDLPEFIEKYETASENEKVVLNIQKIFKAFNAGDYKYVYNKLDKTFKENNFREQADFENYIKQKLYTNNNVSYENYEKSGDIYIYKLKIKDNDKVYNEIKNIDLIMKLDDNMDFYISFNMEE